MSLSPLKIIPAGAGSGKTYKIQKQLAEWVTSGLVAPDRIVAVTFTEAAAAELRDRIRTELVSLGRLEDALKLEQAYISTIHGFGLRIISEFAFDAGISPAPRLLNEDEENVLIRLALATTDKADKVMGNLGAFGYRYDFNTGNGPEDQFKNNVLGLIGKLRSIGRLDEDAVIIPHAVKRIVDLYGKTKTAGHLKKVLLDAVTKLIKKFPADLSPGYEGVKSACNELKSNYRDLRRASIGVPLDADWQIWQRLRNLRVSNRSTKMPDGYDDLALAIMAAAEELPCHPGPLADALLHVEGLLGASQECLHHYAEEKRAKGLVDYTDMIALSNDILVNRHEVLASMKERVDCLVIDEFQDTNPLQFSLLWALSSAGVPTLIVGDLKQAIMGFQNADSRLLAELQQQNSKATEPLTGNWRSTPELMKWVNEVGKGLFGANYTNLKPKADFPVGMAPLEAIDFPVSTRNDIRAQHVAARIKALLNDPKQKVYDKKLGKQRRLQGRDIAILCPTNTRLDNYSQALRSIGIRTLIDQSDWFETRPIQLAYHALSYVADPSDLHAALYLAVTELGHHELETAVASLLRGDPLDEPVLARLDLLAEKSLYLTVDGLVAEVLYTIDLYGIVSQWPEAAQVRANLLRLQGEAAEFLGSNREALASGGYYGSGLKTFLAWLKGKAERDNSQPEPQVLDEDAVQLMTWHRSKGREWPIVAVCSADYEVSPRLPNFSVVYEDFTSLSAILEKARIEISTQFAAPETTASFTEPLQETADKDALKLLYVALTRAREKLILECPRYQKDDGKKTYWTILKAATGMDLDKNRMIVGGKKFDCRIVQTTKDSPPEFEEEHAEPNLTLPVIGRRAIIKGVMPENLTPEAITPSSLHGVETGEGIAVNTIHYGEPLDTELDVSALDRGTILHRCFEILCGRPELGSLVARATGFEFTPGQLAAIGKSVAAFDAWLAREFCPISMSREVPLLAEIAVGSVVAGAIDLLLETEAGFWVIDHKSDQTEDLEERFKYYLPQLKCYADAVSKARADKLVLGIGINWISYGFFSRASLI